MIYMAEIENELECKVRESQIEEETEVQKFLGKTDE